MNGYLTSKDDTFLCCLEAKDFNDMLLLRILKRQKGFNDIPATKILAKNFRYLLIYQDVFFNAKAILFNGSVEEIEEIQDLKKRKINIKKCVVDLKEGVIQYG